MEKLKAYYAHPVILFGSKLQEKDIESIKDAGFEIVNPSDKEKQEGYIKYGMDYFKDLVKESNVVFFRSFFDGSIGQGVYKEINWAIEEGKPIFEMPRRIKNRELSIEDTREVLLECGRR